LDFIDGKLAKDQVNLDLESATAAAYAYDDPESQLSYEDYVKRVLTGSNDRSDEDQMYSRM